MVGYGAIPLSERSSASSQSHNTHTPSTYASLEEVENASLLLEDDHAKFNPRCVFESEAWGTGVAGIGDEISNLLKNIVGSGGLSIPGGIAAFANAPSAVVPSVVVVLIMGAVNAYSFSLLGRICAITKSHTYSMAWERTVGRRYGSRSQLFVDCVVFGKAILGTWSFSIIIASTCTPLVRYVSNFLVERLSEDDTDDTTDGWFGFGSEASHEPSPDVVLVTITLFVLLPLCVSQRLGSLSVFSAIGSLGTFVTITTMALRYFDGSYEEGGKFYADLAPDQRPSFGTDQGAAAFFTSLKSLTLVSILSTGYVAHYNAPKYYYELKDHTTGRFNVVVTVGFWCAAATYTLSSSLGFLTFGQNSLGFILDNYSYRDPLATAARFGVAVSVIFAYPLLFHGGRDGLLALLQTVSSSSSSSDDTAVGTTASANDYDHELTTTNLTNAQSTNTTHKPNHRRTDTVVPTRTESNAVTVLLLFAVTALAICVNDLTFVLSFSGATMSSLIIYVFPPIMFSALVQNCCCYVAEDTDREVKLGYAMMVAGAILGAAGAYVAVERAFW